MSYKEVIGSRADRVAELEARLKDYQLGNTVPAAIKAHIEELEKGNAELRKLADLLQRRIAELEGWEVTK